MQPQASKDAIETPDPNRPGHGEELGIVTVRGILGHTKGLMGSVGDMLLPVDFLVSADVRGKWKPEYEALVGQMVEVKGAHYRYFCGPMEQCLEGGVMNSLHDIEYLQAVD